MLEGLALVMLGEDSQSAGVQGKTDSFGSRVRGGLLVMEQPAAVTGCAAAAQAGEFFPPELALPAANALPGGAWQE